MAAERVRTLHDLQRAIVRARVLRAMIRDAPGQLRRDAAIISYTRTVDDIVAGLEMLHEDGTLDRAIALLARAGAAERDT